MEFKKENLSPIAIAKDLQEAVMSLPDSESWADYFEGGVGRTIIELIAGSQAIKNHYNLMRVRESSLQVAKLDSSITELAINKGVYRPPAKSYKIEVEYTSTGSGTILKGQHLGTFGNYIIYSLETVNYVFGPGNKVLVTVGVGERFEKTIGTSGEFETIEVQSKYKYVSEEFQTLTVNGEVIELIDTELNLYDKNLPNSCLRLVYENFSRLIFGDGIIGKKLEPNDEIVYSFLSFDDDLLEKFDKSRLHLNYMENISEVTNITVLRNPSKYLDKEILRKVAIRNSVDGRWVQVEDYKNGVLREYGEYIYDLLISDDYPEENMVILPKEGMWTPNLENEIRELVDNKRGNATLVNIRYLDPEDSDNRLSLTFNLVYQGPESLGLVREIVDKYIQTKLNKIHFQGYWVVGADLAVELTNISKGKFYCNIDEKEYIEPFQSVKNLTINVLR